MLSARPVASGMILIVDDDPEVRAAHQALVEAGLPGCAVRTAENGESALALMENEVPALVLLDLVMPGLSGADVLDRMRADPRLRQVPVVILSSKLLSLEDVKRLEHHARVILQSKGIWSEKEAIAALNRALFGTETLPAAHQCAGQARGSLPASELRPPAFALGNCRGHWRQRGLPHPRLQP